MTRKHILTALDEGIPFVIKMADGRKYAVRDRHRIAVGGDYVIVVDSEDLPHVLPLLTVTGLSYRDKKRN